MAAKYADFEHLSKVKVRPGRDASPRIRGYALSMARKKRFYLKEWRAQRGMTQQALADATGTSKGYISDLERGNAPYSQKWLETFGEALGIAPSDLLSPPPAGADANDSRSPAADAAVTAPLHDLTPAQFRDAYVGLVRALGGDRAADEVSRDDFAALLAATQDYMAGKDGDLTNYLSGYLLITAGADAGVAPIDDRFDLDRWERLAHQTAQLLVDMAAPPRQRRKSQ